MKKSLLLLFGLVLVFVSFASSVVTSSIAHATECSAGEELLINGDLELPNITDWDFKLEEDVPGWETDAPSGNFEFWGTGLDLFDGVNADGPYTAHDGDQFIELISDAAEPVFQDFNTVPGETLTISFYALGRQISGDANLQVLAGPVAGIPTLLGTPRAGPEEWTQFIYTYTVPTGQTTTRLLLNPDFEALIGSPLIDTVSVSVASCPTALEESLLAHTGANLLLPLMGLSAVVMGALFLTFARMKMFSGN